MYKLIVVDDETLTRDALCDYFPWNQLGFEVIARFDNGKAALDYLKINSSDVVLCDVVMPVMSGLELAKELQAINHPAKLIFISGHDDFEYVRKGMLYGVRNYILKPTKYNELIEVFNLISNELSQTSMDNQFQNLNDTEVGYRQKVIETVKNYASVNLKNATLEEAGRIVHMNASYLSLFFKQVTGQNFSDFFMETKMKKAAELLRDINLRISEISELLGYTNPNNFARAFKLFYGVGPKSFRFKN